MYDEVVYLFKFYKFVYKQFLWINNNKVYTNVVYKFIYFSYQLDIELHKVNIIFLKK